LSDAGGPGCLPLTGSFWAGDRSLIGQLQTVAVLKCVRGSRHSTLTV